MTLSGRPHPDVCFGVSWWSRRAVAALIAPGRPAPRFAATFEDALSQARRTGRLYAWASRIGDEEEKRCAKAGLRLIRIEDGFIRSIGLGAGLAPPCSCAVDEEGVYFDARRPSALETMLLGEEVSAGERARAAGLVEAVVALGLTKYNVGAGDGLGEKPPLGRDIVLAPGQVADDASLRLSLFTPPPDEPNPNLALLRAVRERWPRAHVIFKPHPDVESGLRPGGAADRAVLRFADQIARGADVSRLIARCDRVETVSSLVGFEALLRGKPVTAHGAPFYAGWGATEDMIACPRRGRRRTSTELAHFALIRYCRYVDPMSLAPIEPEALLTALARLRGDAIRRAQRTAMRRLSWAGRRLGL